MDSTRPITPPPAIPLPQRPPAPSADRALPLDGPRVMGILNITPDSFSDGGRWTDPETALAQARRMIAEGAAILDIGGESTRPGSKRVPADEQWRRIGPVIERLGAEPEVRISVDTTSAEVARRALDAGVVMLNDVSAGRDDPAMLPLAAERGAPIVLMHMQGEPGTMQDDPRYDDAVTEVRDFLLRRADAAIAAGVAASGVLIDPGIGFGKQQDHNLALLAHLDALVTTGYPVLLGASRKRFMGALLTAPDGTAPRPETLAPATCAVTALGVAAGVAILRVHDVAANVQAMVTARAIASARRVAPG